MHCRIYGLRVRIDTSGFLFVNLCIEINITFKIPAFAFTHLTWDIREFANGIRVFVNERVFIGFRDSRTVGAYTRITCRRCQYASRIHRNRRKKDDHT